MDTRLIELLAPPDRVAQLQELFTVRDALDVWSHQTPDGRTAMHVVMAADKVDELMAALEPMVAAGTVGRVLLLPVQAMLPRLPDPEPEPTAAAGTTPEPVARRLFGALNISREELYAQISGSARLSGVYFLTIGLSTTVAIVGLRRSNVAIIIGAMVIAPLLGPNVALALATTLGDVQLGRNAVRTSLAGVTFAVAISIAAGLLLPLDPSTPEIASRTVVGMGDVVLALASGAAGALAFTTGVPAALIGVMVAVALLPPTVTFGLLLGDGRLGAAGGAGLLLLVNLVSVNLAAVAMFLLQGIRPAQWWEAEQAKRAAHRAIVLWGALLVLLSVAIWLAHRT